MRTEGSHDVGIGQNWRRGGVQAREEHIKYYSGFRTQVKSINLVLLLLTLQKKKKKKKKNTSLGRSLVFKFKAK